jgi:hypothetical protein
MAFLALCINSSKINLGIIYYYWQQLCIGYLVAVGSKYIIEALIIEMPILIASAGNAVAEAYRSIIKGNA